MIESKSFGSKAFKVINAIILILLAFSCFYPLWYTFCVSISSKAVASLGAGGLGFKLRGRKKNEDEE